MIRPLALASIAALLLAGHARATTLTCGGLDFAMDAQNKVLEQSYISELMEVENRLTPVLGGLTDVQEIHLASAARQLCSHHPEMLFDVAGANAYLFVSGHQASPEPQ